MLNTAAVSDAAESANRDPGALTRVGYVMTHYPLVSQTFIEREIAEVQRHGINVHLFAMNAPTLADLTARGAEAKRDRTTYLKASWPAAMLDYATSLISHPVAITCLTLRAIRSARSDVMLMGRRLSHLLQAARLARLCGKQRILHLHAHFGLAPATIAWFATEIARIHGRSATFGFTIHGFQDFLEPLTARLDLKARFASYVICVSDFTRSQLCRATSPELWGRFRVIRCGVDLERLAFRPRSEQGPRLRIIALGRLSPEKGFGVLISALKQLRNEGRDIELHIVGEGPSRSELEDMVRQNELCDAVCLSGELVPEAALDALCAADIFCLPSFSEGLPVSIMEAMAAGVPVVTTWIAGIPELAVDNKTALTVPPGRSDALADAIRRLWLNPQLRTRLAEAARKQVENLHDAAANGEEVARLLLEQVQ